VLEAGGVDDVGSVDDVDARSSFTRSGGAAGRRDEQTGCEADECVGEVSAGDRPIYGIGPRSDSLRLSV